MPQRGVLPDLEAALGELETALNSLDGSRSAANRALKVIFRINNRIGVAAREDRVLKPALVGVQASLNFVTIEVKRGDGAGALSALGDTRRVLRSSRSLGGRDATFQKEFIEKSNIEKR